MFVLFRVFIGILIWGCATGAVAATQAELDQARNKGLAWLFLNQTGDGSWKSASGLEIQPTSAALEVFLNAGIKSGYAYAAAGAWLGNAETFSIESLSRQSIPLFRSGANVASLMSRLLAMRHPLTKSWGAYDRYAGSFPDTALAMSAITQTNTAYADTGASLGFIQGKQNADGGWPYSKEAPTTPQSCVIPTAYSLVTFSRYKSLGWNVDANITKGVNWLIGRKKSDGGFADDSTATSGSVYETALAYLALAEAKKAGNTAATAAQAVMDGAHNFLIARQQIDGSWGTEPFQTALALQTLSTTTLPDADKDGIPDSVEPLLGTNPTVADGRVLVKGNGQNISGVTTPVLVGTAVLNQAFSATLTASWGTAPYAWKIVSGSLPNGLSLNGGTGAIGGSPTVIGSFNFSYSATDSKGVGRTSLAQISVISPPVATAKVSALSVTPTFAGEERAMATTTVVSVEPSVIAADYTGVVGIAVNGLMAPGAEVLVEQMVDANRNGLVDTPDYLIRSFTVADGTTAFYPNDQGDEDATVNSAVATSLDYRLLNDLYHAPGQYFFRVTQGTQVSAARFTVEPVSRLQTISGTVIAGDQPIPGAMVRLVDRWHRTLAFVLSDDAGQYTFNVKESDIYAVIPSSYGFAAIHAGADKIPLAVGQNLFGQDLPMTPGVYRLGGRVRTAASDAGISGVWVIAAGSKYSGVAITDASGDYDLLLPAGRYRVTATADVAEPNAFFKGYVGFDNQLVNVDLTDHVTEVHLTLPKADGFVSGRVLDQFGLGVPGLAVQGKGAGATDAWEPVSYGITDADGVYTLGIISALDWDIFLNESTAQTLGHVGSSMGKVSPAAGLALETDLLSHTITAWIEGVVKDSAGNPLQEVAVKIRNVDSNVIVNMATAADGTFRLGAYAGTWVFDALTEDKGYAPMSEQSVTLTDGQTVTTESVATVAKSNSGQETRRGEKP